MTKLHIVPSPYTETLPPYTNIDWWFTEALRETEQKKYREALSIFENIINHCPQKERVLVNIAFIQNKQGNRLRAEVTCREAITIEPRYVLALFTLSVCLEKQDRYLEAIYYYLRAVEIEPENICCHYNLAGCSYDAGQWESAAKHYRIYLKIGVTDDLPSRQYARVMLEKLGTTIIHIVR